MSDAYATLASGGVHHKPIAIRKVEFPDGHVDDVGEPESNRVFSDGVAYEVTQVLKDNIIGGTGVAAYTGCGDQAGKTGTTDDYNDAWFVGYTPTLAASVWVGYPDALESMYSVHGITVAGGTFPAEIWNDFMSTALTDCETFPAPENPVDWIPFYGKYAQASGSASCGSTSGTGTSEGSYGSCSTSSDTTTEDTSKRPDAFAPDDSKPVPKPKPKPPPKPPPPPPPPPPDPPGGGTGTG
jgi:penicillin-binding protein 1A